MATEVPAAQYVPESENPNPEGILPWATPIENGNVGSVQDVHKESMKFAAALEAFSTVEISLSGDQGNGLQRQRTWFVQALIPGLPDKFPVYGIKETRKMNKDLLVLTLEIYVFNGQERLKIGTCYYTINKNKSFGEFRLLTEVGKYNLISGNVIGGTPYIYDSGGTAKFNLPVVENSKKKVVFQARPAVQHASTQPLAESRLHIEGSWSKKKFKLLMIDFGALTEAILKPEIVLSSFIQVFMKNL